MDNSNKLKVGDKIRVFSSVPFFDTIITQIKEHKIWFIDPTDNKPAWEFEDFIKVLSSEDPIEHVKFNSSLEPDTIIKIEKSEDTINYVFRCNDSDRDITQIELTKEDLLKLANQILKYTNQ